MTQLLIDRVVEQDTPARVSVKRSGIHGRGLFAEEPIEAGTYIGRYEGPITRRNGAYVLWIIEEDGNAYGINGKNEMRFVNHSDQPNAELHNEEFYALRDIRPGEEITIDYGPEWR